MTYDPIKQDFLFREAFRRCIVNDCLVISGADGTEAEAIADRDAAAEAANLEAIDDEVGPDDSASHVGSVASVVSVAGRDAPLTKKPAGARSALGPVSEDAEPDESEAPGLDESKSVMSKLDKIGPARSVYSRATLAADRSPAPSVAHSVAPSLAQGEAQSVAPSLAPSVVPKVKTSDLKSNVSRASGQTATSVMRKAINVRKVHIEPEP